MGEMRGLLIHTAADTTTLGVVGPIFPDGSFEYIPIRNSFGIEEKNYSDFPARNTKYGKTLADFLPSDVSRLSVHYDPDFENYIYGQDLSPHPRARALSNLRVGDVVFFVFSLAPYDPEVYRDKDNRLLNFQRGRRNKYVTGFFTVKDVAKVYVFKSSGRLALALLNIPYHEQGESLLDMKSLEKELKMLEEMNYIYRENDKYKLTREGGNFSRSGEDMLSFISEILPGDREDALQLLENGYIMIDSLTNNITEKIVKLSHHYKRLKKLDYDQFILVMGDPDKFALLNRAIPLTMGYEGYWYKLNELGQAILKKKMTHSEVHDGLITMQPNY